MHPVRPIPSKMPPFNKGFGDGFPTSCIAMNYYYNLDNQNLYVGLQNQQLNIYPLVPYSIAKAFDHTRNPDDFYVKSIAGFYNPCLMTEVCVPLLTEDHNYMVST